jgi:hypothetical protein
LIGLIILFFLLIKQVKELPKLARQLLYTKAARVRFMEHHPSILHLIAAVQLKTS